MSAWGMAQNFLSIPSAMREYERQNMLVEDLLARGATRIYSDYWTCNRLMFHSHERILCISVSPDLKAFYNRYPPHVDAVKVAAHPAYLFTRRDITLKTIEQELHLFEHGYQRLELDGYVMYIYIASR